MGQARLIGIRNSFVLQHTIQDKIIKGINILINIRKSLTYQRYNKFITDRQTE